MSSMDTTYNHKIQHGRDPFLMIYRVVVLIPVQVGESSYHYLKFGETNNKSLRGSLDLLKNQWEINLICMIDLKQRIDISYKCKTKLHYFKSRDWVLREVTLRTQNPKKGKIGSQIVRFIQNSGITGKGTYQLIVLWGNQQHNNQNVNYLKRYYYQGNSLCMPYTLFPFSWTFYPIHIFCQQGF